MFNKEGHEIQSRLICLEKELCGRLYRDKMMRILYATDASAYRELPLAVAVPENPEDIKKLIRFADQEKIGLIPRCGGTSLAGQVVGSGIAVDLSKHFTSILEYNPKEKWVRVQPGVIRDVLNIFLKPFGLFFAPETSTANRAMIGGMAGNNSCGANSIIYGTTREHLLEVKAILSDGSEAVFKGLSTDTFHQKRGQNSLEGKLYDETYQLLNNSENQEEIHKEFPKKTVKRRNTGYALDSLLETAPFTPEGPDFNFCRLLAGSEGTLAFITELKLNLEPIPKGEKGLLCVHFNSIDEALRANIIALKYQPSASELIDHYILECTKDNIEQSRNRFFVKGDPQAILIIEFIRQSRDEVNAAASQLETEMRANGLGYHFPIIFGPDTAKIWDLRKAGLGLLGNMPGDEKAVPVIEDTAVDVNDLASYIRDFNEILKQYDLYSVHYAHAGAGELHLRPIINLKTSTGNLLFRKIAEEIAVLVKKYQGSLSGEHGDGRLRGEFIPQMVGQKNYELFRQVKQLWDPKGVFNPGKITDTPPMNTSLRYEPDKPQPKFDTIFRFKNQNILQHAEQCNGTGECRKLHLSGGTMCPSYMATRNEKDTTRGRANVLREFLTNSTKINRFDHEEIREVMDLCLSCKGCKSECPSNVDVAKLKAEFTQHYYDANGAPLRAKIIANFALLSKAGSLFPSLYNFFSGNRLTALLGFSPKRTVPKLHSFTLKNWYKKHQSDKTPGKKKVYFFCDEFTNYTDTEIGIKAILLLERLGYEVVIPDHIESGRTWLSKGFLRRAKKIADKNIKMLNGLISAETPLIGLEPSAILTFRDEYPDLAAEELLETSKKLAENVFLFEEFIAKEIGAGNIDSSIFTKDEKLIKLHGHCHQKSLSSLKFTETILRLPENYLVETIPSGCCGMAGSFGMEKEHYEVSMQIGELVLFPAVRQSNADCIIAAPGTSCRHQIKDGTERTALHPAEILFDALA